MSTKNCQFEPLQEDERRLLAEERFNLDIVLQLLTLREQRGLSQAELAVMIGTRQQAISRMESPGYDRHSLTTLRRVTEALGAFLDVTLVPEDKLQEYMDWRYQPVLMETAPGKEQTRPIIWQVVVGGAISVTSEAQGANRQGPKVTYSEISNTMMFDEEAVA